MNFKKLKNFSKYRFYEDGRIWSEINNIFIKPHKKSGSVRKDGSCYYQVGLSSDDGVNKNYSVHSLICAAFHGDRPDGYECDHINGQRHDNRACNLEWVTPQENQRRSGVLSRYVFSDSDCRRIDELYESYPITYIAKCLNTSSAVIKSSLVSRGIFDGRKNTMGRVNSKISKTEVQKAIELHKTGLYNHSEIVSELGLNATSSAIGYYLKKLDSQTYYRNLNICNEYSSGVDINDLINKYSIKLSRIRRILKNGGVKLLKKDEHDKMCTETQKIKPNEFDNVSKMISNGLSIPEIAKEYGCGIGAVERALKRFGLSPSGVQRKYDYKKLYEMNLEMPQWKIAEKLGVTQSNVAKMIKTYKKENGIVGHGNVLRHAERRSLP